MTKQTTKILVNEVFNTLYDFDTKTKTITKVIPCYSDKKVKPTFERLEFEYNKTEYRNFTKRDYNNLDLICNYYLEDGSRPYKPTKTICKNCQFNSNCK